MYENQPRTNMHQQGLTEAFSPTSPSPATSIGDSIFIVRGLIGTALLLLGDAYLLVEEYMRACAKEKSVSHRHRKRPVSEREHREAIPGAKLLCEQAPPSG